VWAKFDATARLASSGSYRNARFPVGTRNFAPKHATMVGSRWSALLALALLTTTATTTCGAGGKNVAVGGVRADAGDISSVRVYTTTTDQSHLFAEQPRVPLNPLPPTPRPQPTVRINSTIVHQEMVGFGAAITDAAAWVLHSAPAELSNRLLQLLFSPFSASSSSDAPCADEKRGCAEAVADGLLSCATDLCPTCPKAGDCDRTCGFCRAAADAGLGLSVVRISMGVSDFSRSYALGNITYADTPGDWALEHFSTDHDDAYILPVLRRAKELNPALRVMASPWTAPLWLKDPPGQAPDQLGAGTLLDTPQAYDTYVYQYRALRSFLHRRRGHIIADGPRLTLDFCTVRAKK
jgi:hypothetical protein